MVRILPRLSDERLVDWLLAHGCSPSLSHKKRPPHFGKALDGAICEYLDAYVLPVAMPKRLTAAAAIVDIFLDGTKISVITSQSYHTEGHDHV